jgi:hypothetical protein
MWPDAPPGAVFIRAGSTEQPGFVDAQNRPMAPQEVASVIYSGWIVNVTIRAYCY